jgi:uncharacterized protein YndB with AHSA1/START domain
MAATAQAQTAAQEFEIVRVVDAPRDLVWKSWTELERLKQWWGPKGCTVFSATLDLKPGGVFHYGLRMPEGFELWGKFVFRDISKPDRLVFLSSFADAQANVVRAPFFDGKWPMHMLTTVSFTERGGKTEISVRWMPHEANAEELAMFATQKPSLNQGWSGTFERLTNYLKQA